MIIRELLWHKHQELNSLIMKKYSNNFFLKLIDKTYQYITRSLAQLIKFLTLVQPKNK